MTNGTVARTKRVMVLLSVVFLGGCTMVGAGLGVSEDRAAVMQAVPIEQVDPIPDVAGTWTGWVTAGGTRLASSLTLPQTGPPLELRFDSEGFGLTATGEGEVTTTGVLTLSFRYNVDCPGVARIEATLDETGLGLTGSLIAEDCTGGATGTVDFARPRGGRAPRTR